eukprot:Em0020g348a
MDYHSQNSWDAEYEALVDLEAQMRAKLRERDKSPHQNTKLSGLLDSLLQEFQQGVQRLSTSLSKRALIGVSEQEKAKRRGAVDEMTTKYNELKQLIANGASGATGASVGPGRVHRLSADDIRLQQKQIIDEQDRGLEALSQALRRQQNMGLAIQEEVVTHNEIIDGIHDATTKTDQKIKRRTQQVNEVRKKDSCWCTCGLWTTIILLAIAIIIIATVQYKKS